MVGLGGSTLKCTGGCWARGGDGGIWVGGGESAPELTSLLSSDWTEGGGTRAGSADAD